MQEEQLAGVQVGAGGTCGPGPLALTRVGERLHAGRLLAGGVACPVSCWRVVAHQPIDRHPCCHIICIRHKIVAAAEVSCGQRGSVQVVVVVEVFLH